MKFLSVFSYLKQLFIEGGIEVETKENGKIVMRTLIQPDGDITMHVTKEFPDIDIYQNHLKKIRENISSISGFTSLFNSIKIFSVIPAIFSFYNCLITKTISASLIPSIFLFLLLLSLKKIIFSGFKWQVKRKMNNIEKEWPHEYVPE